MAMAGNRLTNVFSTTAKGRAARSAKARLFVRKLENGLQGKP